MVFLQKDAVSPELIAILDNSEDLVVRFESERTQHHDVDTRALLSEVESGDSSASERLWSLVYEELHALAESYFRHQSDSHTLQPTALVHEVFLRFVNQPEATINNRAHFMAIAARAMRQILVDYARRKGAAKRGGGATRISITTTDDVADSTDVDMSAVQDALVRLIALDERKGRIVEMRFFGGLTVEETSIALGISRTTVSEEWRFARAWMVHELEHEAKQ